MTLRVDHRQLADYRRHPTKCVANIWEKMMGLFDFLRPKSKPTDPLAELAFAVFPGAHKQVVSETRELHQQLRGALTEEEAGLLLTRAKTLLYRTQDKSFLRCRDYIITRGGNKLSESQARLVYEFMCRKLSIAPDHTVSIEQENEAKMLLHVRQMAAAYADGVDADAILKGHGPFGLCETNPVPTSSINGSEKYLARLRTKDGREIQYHRFGSTSSDVTKGAIDIYDISVDGKALTTLFICPYHLKDSVKAPEGFELV